MGSSSFTVVTAASLERTGIPVMWASLPGTIPGGIGSIALRGTSAEFSDIAMSSSSVAVAMSMVVLVELLLSSGMVTSSFGSSTVLSPWTKPGYLCHHTSGRCSGNLEQISVDQHRHLVQVCQLEELTRVEDAAVGQSAMPLQAVPDADALASGLAASALTLAG